VRGKGERENGGKGKRGKENKVLPETESIFLDLCVFYSDLGARERHDFTKK